MQKDNGKEKKEKTNKEGMGKRKLWRSKGGIGREKENEATRSSSKKKYRKPSVIRFSWHFNHTCTIDPLPLLSI